MNIYLEAFGIFFKIGAFTIVGGYAMVPLIENEIVPKRKWIAQEDFIDLLAISQSAPGILAVNISIFIGYKLRGIRGSIITALGTILPSFIIILAIALFFHSFKDNPIVERIFKGIRPAVVALIAAPTFTCGGNLEKLRVENGEWRVEKARINAVVLQIHNSKSREIRVIHA